MKQLLQNCTFRKPQAIATFEMWWHTRRNQIWSVREMDESI